MKKTQFIKITTLAVMITVFLLSAIVFIGSASENISSGTDEPAELFAYLAGYVIAEAFLAFAICNVKSGKTSKTPICIALAGLVVLLVHDIITAASDGFLLPGLFRLEVFLLLDILMAACTVLLIIRDGKAVRLLLAVFSAVYIFGEVAGYPMATFDDFDEAMLLLNLFITSLAPLLTNEKCE